MPNYSGSWTRTQQMQAIAAGTWTGIPPVIGQAYGGGYYAGSISTAGNGVADYYLIVADATVGSVNGLQWKTSQTTTAGTSSVIDGPANSAAMNDASHPAAQFCEALNTGGYTDWYMPAKNELEVCYYFLKPGTASNNTSSGSNANAVSPEPASTNYSAGSPAQTSVTSFRTGASSQEFSTGDWWSSTQNSASSAEQQGFNTGYQSQDAKTAANLNVRAIRRVAV